jgi:LPS export ABC transporter protein LptC
MPSGRRCRWALALAAWLALAGCGGGEQVGEEQHATRPDQEISGFTLTQTQDGRRVWSLRAREALVFEESDRVEATGVRVDFYGREAELQSTLTAGKGVIVRRTNAIEVEGSVVVTSADGTVLTTERLLWDERTGRIRSDTAVRVTKGSDVVTGSGMEADPDLRNLKVRDFKAFVRTPEGQLVEEE